MGLGAPEGGRDQTADYFRTRRASKPVFRFAGAVCLPRSGRWCGATRPARSLAALAPADEAPRRRRPGRPTESCARRRRPAARPDNPGGLPDRSGPGADDLTQTADGATWTLTGDAYVAQGMTYTYNADVGEQTKQRIRGIPPAQHRGQSGQAGSSDPNDWSPEQFCISFSGGDSLENGGIWNNVQGHDTRHIVLSGTSPHTLTATFTVAADAPTWQHHRVRCHKKHRFA